MNTRIVALLIDFNFLYFVIHEHCHQHYYVMKEIQFNKIEELFSIFRDKGNELESR